MITVKPSVQFSHVSFSRAANPVFRDLSLTISEGEHVALLGTNGSGKSTLLDLIAGELSPQQGRVHRSHAHYAFVPQRTSLSDHIPMTVHNAVMMGRWGSLRFWQRPSLNDRRIVTEHIEELGLSDLTHSQLTELSGGQRQRVLIAQALAQQAPLIMLDEPEAGLDTTAREIIRKALRGASRSGTTVIIATHELGSAHNADRCVLLKGDAGGIIADGAPTEVLTDHSLAQAFL